MNCIFPPAYFGYQMMESIKGDENYNKEIEKLLQKYSSNYKIGADQFEKKVGYGGTKGF